MSFFLFPSCIDCGSKRNLSRYITSFFWICPYCSKRRAVELLQEFLLKEGFSEKERQHMRKTVQRLKRQLAVMAKKPENEKAVNYEKFLALCKQMKGE